MLLALLELCRHGQPNLALLGLRQLVLLALLELCRHGQPHLALLGSVLQALLVLRLVPLQ